MSLVIVEGNISAGKSTLCRDLANILDYELYLEPALSNPYLARFYQNPKRYALKMQIWLLRQRFRVYLDAVKLIASTGRGVVLDRSVYSDWVFAEKNRLDQNISASGFEGYSKLRDQMLSHLPLPDVMVFLDVSPTECYRRVHMLRCRDVELGIPLEYLAGLGECYHRFVKSMTSKGVLVHSLDWAAFGNSKKVAGLIDGKMQTILPSTVVDFINDTEATSKALEIDMRLFEKDWEDDEQEEEFALQPRAEEEGMGYTSNEK